LKLPVIKTIDDVAQRQMCAGCGACAAVNPDGIEMIDDLNFGRRPMAVTASRNRTQLELDVCPGIGLTHEHHDADSDVPGWGPVLEVWEGHATDETIRFHGSSGGAATALALACLETMKMHGVVHTAARQDAPIFNETVMSRTREDLLAASGSRYAPASPCEGLPMIEHTPKPCVFIGKPCDIAGAVNVAALRPKLRAKLGLTVSIFCAGTPTTRATYGLLERLGVTDPEEVVSLRYRGHGWPGETTATLRTGETRTLPYEQAWGEILTNDKQWRCHVCADHSGEFADISVGDAWHMPRAPGETGRSLIVVRTERGRRILHKAMRAGYLTLRRANVSELNASQPGFLAVRGAVWGRVLACRLLGLPAPRYRGMPMFQFWWSELNWRPGIDHDPLPGGNGVEPHDVLRGMLRMLMMRTLADADNPRSLSNRLRTRRMELFESLIAPLPRPVRIVDLGGTPSFWEHRGWAGRAEVEITTVNLHPEVSPHVNIRCLAGDVTGENLLRGQQFDVAFSNSVIEHLFTWSGQQAMARVMRRLAPAIWLQTPNFWFPMEPHFHVPGWQWLPKRLRVAIIRRRRCGWRGPCPDPHDARALVDEVQLLSKRQLSALFPTATIVPERLAGLTKSWIVHEGFASLPSSLLKAA